MSEGWRLDLHGFAELDQALGQLPDEIGRRVLRGAMTRPVRILQDGMARRAPHLTGRLEANIEAAYEKTDRGLTAHLGPARIAFYGMFAELGTAHEPARPFMRPTLDEDGPAAVQALGEDLAAGIANAAQRLARKVG